MLPLRDRLPTRRPPYVTYALIAVNVAAFVWMQSLIATGTDPQRLVRAWGLVPARFFQAPVADLGTLFSSMFMHDPSGLLHVGGNMLFLWIFGDNVEDALGHLRYAAFYLLSGLAAAAAQILVDPGSTIAMVGASGAISGVLAAYGSLYPRSPILVLNPIPLLWFVFGLFLELPAWIIILEYFVMNVIEGLGSIGARTGGVAFFAHLGGFVAGLVLVRFFMIGRSPQQHERWKTFRAPPRRPRPRGGDPFRRPPPRSPWEW